jgi:hypothetical protein
MDKVTCTLQQEHPFVGSKEISIYGPDQISNAVAAVKRLPMLVIDNFNEPSFRLHHDNRADLGNNVGVAQWRKSLAPHREILVR